MAVGYEHIPDPVGIRNVGSNVELFLLSLSIRWWDDNSKVRLPGELNLLHPTQHANNGPWSVDALGLHRLIVKDNLAIVKYYLDFSGDISVKSGNRQKLACETVVISSFRHTRFKVYSFVRNIGTSPLHICCCPTFNEDLNLLEGESM